MQIFKYSLDPRQDYIELPKGARILSIQSQYEVPQLWALVDSKNPIVKRKVIFAVTGQNLTNDELKGMLYVATGQLSHGNFVYHVFIEEEK